MDKSDKRAVLVIELTPDRLEEFRISAMLRGTTMSSLVSEFVDAVIEEEKLTVPEAFKRRQFPPADDDGLTLRK